MKVTKISQSLLKELFSYKIGEQCGLKIVAKYIANKSEESSPQMDMGNWFEYKATGQLPRSGKEPLPETLKSGELSVGYRRLEKQLTHYHRILESYGIEILETGKSFDSHPFANGIADIIGMWDGKKVIIDIKTTAQIDNRWEKFGWGDEKFENPDSPEAQHLTIQAVQYKMLAKQEWGIEDMPFYFFVFSTTDENHAKIFEVEVNPDRLIAHEEQVKQAYDYFNKSFIWKTSEDLARPQMKRCLECFVKDECPMKIDVPLIKKIQVS